MGLSLRHYLFLENGELRRLSARLVNGLIRDQDAMPDFANSTQRVLDVFLENENKIPQRIVRSDASIWHFDAEGRVLDDLRDAAIQRMDLSYRDSGTEDGNVVDLVAKRQSQILDEKYRWQPTPADIDRVVADIWRKKGQPPAKNAQGKAPRKPPKTWDSERVSDEAASAFWKLADNLSDLKDPSLKAVIFKARDMAEDPIDDTAPLWRGLAEVAERRLEINRRYRSGKGTWYACVDVVYHRPHERFSETIKTLHEKCEGRDEAVEATKRLMADAIKHIRADVTLEHMVLPDLEWEVRS